MEFGFEPICNQLRAGSSYLNMTCFSKDVPFGGFVDMPPHLWCQIPQNPNFWFVNRRFPAKLVKSKNMHIIKTTASIPTKFCTMIKTTKCPSWVVQTRSIQIHILKIQDGGDRHLEKSKNCHISATVWPIGTKFGKVTPFVVLSLSTPKISTF